VPETVNSNGISCRLGLVCTPPCICSSSTYRIIQDLLTRKSEIRNIFVGELRVNSSEENPPKRTQHILNIVSDDCLVGHMTKWGNVPPDISETSIDFALGHLNIYGFAVWADTVADNLLPETYFSFTNLSNIKLTIKNTKTKYALSFSSPHSFCLFLTDRLARSYEFTETAGLRWPINIYQRASAVVPLISMIALLRQSGSGSEFPTVEKNLASIRN
jgi:hypothetical protein